MHLGLRLGANVPEPLEIEDVGKGLGADHPRGVEFGTGLLAQGAAVHHKADPAIAHA